MLITLSQKDIKAIIEALEKDPKQVEDKYSTLSYLKIVTSPDFDTQANIELDDIPF
jgi:hypothetical protein